MKNKQQILDDFIIPEGLEFREEYLQSAMHMYNRERRKAIWIKRSIFAVIILLLATGSAVWLSQNQEATVEVVEKGDAANKEMPSAENPIKNTQDSSQPDTRSTKIDSSNQTNRNDEFKDLTVPVVSENKKTEAIQANTMGEKKTENLNRKISKPNLTKNNARSAEANDHGGSLGSGSGLPGQLPLSFEEKETVKVNNALTVSDVITQSNVKNVDSSTVEEIQDLKNESSEKARPTGDYKNMLALKSVPFESNSTLSIASVNPINAPNTNKFKPYLVIGVSPITDFGLRYSQFNLNPYVALGLDKRLGNGWRAAADARYYFVSGLSHPLSFEETTYGQGFETTTTTIYTNRLHYAGVNLSLQKRIAKHQFALSYGLDYLITGQNDIQNRTIGSLENTSENSTDSKGYVIGFRNFNHSISLGYDYWLGQNKAIGFNYQFGLTDISNDQYFTLGTVDRNSMLTLRLKMYLR